MSLLPPHAIDEFQALWNEHYGTELPREDAAQRAHQIFTLVRLLAQKPPSQAAPAQALPPQAPPSGAPTRTHTPGAAEAEAGR